MTQELLRGHRKFHREYVADERYFLERLASEGQSPDALYIGCSDSRVVPVLSVVEGEPRARRSPWRLNPLPGDPK